MATNDSEFASRLELASGILLLGAFLFLLYWVFQRFFTGGTTVHPDPGRSGGGGGTRHGRFHSVNVV
jgi:hypothetical protein